MYINTFKYTPKDVSCQLCTEYVKKLGCTALRCPWLAERIEAGVVGYREAVLETFPHERRLFQRLNLLIKHYPGSLWSNEQHERRMQYQCAVQGYESTHDYDEYHFDLDTIEHDPYVLISIITALHQGEWTLDEVQGTLQMLFDRQYILTEDVVVEVRYRTVTRTDSEGNNYDVEVPYNYYICTVTLENFNLSHLPVYLMGEETLSRYALYMATLGNRPDLFPSSPYVGKYTNKPPAHEIPEDYLADETFAAILKEAEKYVGYPYVWGGSSPSTSFDCSGFVSYVYNQCGWSFGRLGAQGLYNISTRTSSPKPGDLVFFTGTYDTQGISHVGIYVGDGWMLHCGDPISYANLNTSYWQSHFYAYGKLF